MTTAVVARARATARLALLNMHQLVRFNPAEARFGKGVATGGRWRKLSDVVTDALKAYKGDDLDEALKDFNPRQLRTAAEGLGLKPRPRAQRHELQAMIGQHVLGDRVKVTSPAKKATPKSAPNRATIASRKAALEDLHAAGGQSSHPDANPATLDALEREGLIRREGHVVHLTDAGRAELAKPPRKATPRKATAKPASAGLSTDPKVRAAQVEDRIRAAVQELEREPGAWVSLADLRDNLGGDIPRQDTDQALVALSRMDNVRVTPESNQKVMDQRDRAAAVVIGNRDKHLIRIEPASARAAELRRQASEARQMAGGSFHSSVSPDDQVRLRAEYRARADRLEAQATQLLQADAARRAASAAHSAKAAPVKATPRAAAKVAAAKAARPNPADVRARLLDMPPGERKPYLEGLGLSQAQANALAKELGARQTRISVDATLDSIVKHFADAPSPALSKSTPRAPKAAAPTPDEAVAALASAKGRDEAHAVLEGMSVADMKETARRLSVDARGLNKANLRQALVEATAGVRADRDGILGGWSSGNPLSPSSSPAVAKATAAKAAVRTTPTYAPPTSLTAAERDQAERLIRADPQIFATTHERFGNISSSGNLSPEDAAWLQALYEREPAFVNHLAQAAQIDRALKAEAKRSGQTPAAYRAEAAGRLKAVVADKPVVVRVRDDDALRGILDEGRFKTSFDPGTRRAPGLAVNADSRRLGEEILGVPADTPPERRPVYGYVAIGGVEPALSAGRKIPGIHQREGQEDVLSTYGQVQVVLKPQVRPHTTVTVGDSLDEVGLMRPSPIDNPSADSLGIRGRHLDEIGSPGWTRRGYIEAQVHGGVPADDIDRVVFSAEPAPSLVERLRERGIPWTILREGEQDAPSPNPNGAAVTKVAAAKAARVPAEDFDPDGVAERIHQLPNSDKTVENITPQLAGYTSRQLRRIATATSVRLPKKPPGGQPAWTAELIARYIAEEIQRDRTRWSLRSDAPDPDDILRAEYDPLATLDALAETLGGIPSKHRESERALTPLGKQLRELRGRFASGDLDRDTLVKELQRLNPAQGEDDMEALERKGVDPHVAGAFEEALSGLGDNGHTMAQQHMGAMVALVPSDEDAQRLAVEGGESAMDLHVTLLFLGEAADYDDDQRQEILDAARQIADDLGDVVEAEGFALSLFNPKGEDPCIVLGLTGEDLAGAHDLVEDEIDGLDVDMPDLPDQHIPYAPHMTLVYTDDPGEIEGLTDLTGPIVLDRIRVAFGDEVHDFPLGDTESPEEDTSEPGEEAGEYAGRSMSFSDTPWSSFTQADYEPSAWVDATLIHLEPADGQDPDVKSLHRLPVREPDGTLNRNGIHAAASRLGAVDAPADQKRSAARKLVALYRQMDEDPPASLLTAAGVTRAQFNDPDDQILRYAASSTWTKDDEDKHPRGRGAKGGQFVSKQDSRQQADQHVTVYSPTASGGRKRTTQPAKKQPTTQKPRQQIGKAGKETTGPKPPAKRPADQHPAKRRKRGTLPAGAGSGIAGGDPDVRALQDALRRLGLATGKPNGVLGDATIAAVKEVQRRLGLRQSGRVSVSLIHKVENAAKLSNCAQRSNPLDPDDAVRAMSTANMPMAPTGHTSYVDGRDEPLDEVDFDGGSVCAYPTHVAVKVDGMERVRFTPDVAREVADGLNDMADAVEDNPNEPEPDQDHDDMGRSVDYYTNGPGRDEWLDSATPWAVLQDRLEPELGTLASIERATRLVVDTWGGARG